MLLYHKYNLVMTENAKTGSNTCVVMLTALMGGGGEKPKKIYFGEPVGY